MLINYFTVRMDPSPCVRLFKPRLLLRLCSVAFMVVLVQYLGVDPKERKYLIQLTNINAPT